MWEELRILTSPQRKQLHLRKGLIEAPNASPDAPARHLHSTLLIPLCWAPGGSGDLGWMPGLERGTVLLCEPWC